MKIVISVPNDLIKEVDKVALKNHLSRSDVFVLAIREYLDKRRSKRLLDRFNEAYSSADSPEERKVRDHSKKRYAIAGHKERY